MLIKTKVYIIFLYSMASSSYSRHSQLDQIYDNANYSLGGETRREWNNNKILEEWKYT